MRIGGVLGRGFKAADRFGRGGRRLTAFLLMVAVNGATGHGVAAGQRLPALIGADVLHAAGITGRGITVAVLGDVDRVAPEVLSAADGHGRLLAVFDSPSVAGADVPVPPNVPLEAMLSSGRDAEGGYRGIAPNADLVLVRAVGADGAGRPADVARGLDWAVANRDRFGIRVLALPLIAPPRPDTLAEPLGRAVREAWEAGIVVVAAAGDGGPAVATIASPGDLPGIITVGAAAEGPGDWRVEPYSASGPTFDGLVKPEIIAPVGTARDATAPRATGTSISSAVVVGVVALLLEASPGLTPDEVRQRLLTTARPALAPNGEPFSILRQGAGVVDAVAALTAPAVGDPGDRQAGRGLLWSDFAGRGMLWSD